MSDNGIITIHDTDEIYHNTFIVTENSKKDFVEFNGPVKFVKELENNADWNLINLKNFCIFESKRPTTTGLTILTRKS
jgi:hypothetical protein